MLEKFGMGRVPAARFRFVIWLNWNSDLLRSGLTWNRRLWTKPLTSGGNDSKPVSRLKDNILNIYYNFRRTCRLIFDIKAVFLEVITRSFRVDFFYETQCITVTYYYYYSQYYIFLWETQHRPTERHLPYGIAQCYLPSNSPTSLNVPCLNPSQTDW